MAYFPLQIPPGVYKNGTEYQSKGRWNNSNLVRWFEGTMRPVVGWRKRSTNQLTGKTILVIVELVLVLIPSFIQ